MSKAESKHGQTVLFASRGVRHIFAGSPRRKEIEEVPPPTSPEVPGANDNDTPPAQRPYVVPPEPQFIPEPPRRVPRDK